MIFSTVDKIYVVVVVAAVVVDHCIVASRRWA